MCSQLVGTITGGCQPMCSQLVGKITGEKIGSNENKLSISNKNPVREVLTREKMHSGER